jgi:hypothetical protein
VNLRRARLAGWLRTAGETPEISLRFYKKGCVADVRAEQRTGCPGTSR